MKSPTSPPRRRVRGVTNAADANRWVEQKKAEVRKLPQGTQPLHFAVTSAREDCVRVLAEAVKRNTGLGLETTALQGALYEINTILEHLHDRLPQFSTEDELWFRMTDDTASMSNIQLRETVVYLRGQLHQMQEDNDQLVAKNDLYYGKLQRKQKVIQYIRQTIWAELIRVTEQLYRSRDQQDYFNHHVFSIFDFAELTTDGYDDRSADLHERQAMLARFQDQLEDERKRMQLSFEAQMEGTQQELAHCKEENEALRQRLGELSTQWAEHGAGAEQGAADREKYEKQVMAIAGELGEARGLIESQKRIIEQHHAQVDEMTQEHADEVNALRVRCKAAEAQLEQQRKQLATAKEQQAAAAKELQSAKDTLAGQKMKLLALSRFNQAKKEEEDPKGKAKAADGQKSPKDVGRDAGRKDGELAKLREQLEQANARVRKLEESNQAASKDLHGERATAEERVRALLAEKHSLSASLDAVQRQCMQLEDRCVEFQEATQKHKKLHDELVSQRMELRDACKAHEHNERELARKLEQAEEEAAGLRRRLGDQERQVERMQRKVQMMEQSQEQRTEDEVNRRLEQAAEEAARRMAEIKSASGSSVEALQKELLLASERQAKSDFMKARLQMQLNQCREQLQEQKEEAAKERAGRLDISFVLEKTQKQSHKEITMLRVTLLGRDRELARLDGKLKQQRSTIASLRDQVLAMRELVAARSEEGGRRASVAIANGELALRRLGRRMQRCGQMIGSPEDLAAARDQARREAEEFQDDYSEALACARFPSSDQRAEGLAMLTDALGVNVGESSPLPPLACFQSCVHALQWALLCAAQLGAAVTVHWGNGKEGTSTDVADARLLCTGATPPGAVVVTSEAAQAAQLHSPEVRRLLKGAAVWSCVRRVPGRADTDDQLFIIALAGVDDPPPTPSASGPLPTVVQHAQAMNEADGWEVTILRAPEAQPLQVTPLLSSPRSDGAAEGGRPNGLGWAKALVGAVAERGGNRQSLPGASDISDVSPVEASACSALERIAERVRELVSQANVWRLAAAAAEAALQQLQQSARSRGSRSSSGALSPTARRRGSGLHRRRGSGLGAQSDSGESEFSRPVRRPSRLMSAALPGGGGARRRPSTAGSFREAPPALFTGSEAATRPRGAGVIRIPGGRQSSELWGDGSGSPESLASPGPQQWRPPLSGRGDGDGAADHRAAHSPAGGPQSLLRRASRPRNAVFVTEAACQTDYAPGLAPRRSPHLSPRASPHMSPHMSPRMSPLAARSPGPASHVVPRAGALAPDPPILDTAGHLAAERRVAAAAAARLKRAESRPEVPDLSACQPDGVNPYSLNRSLHAAAPNPAGPWVAAQKHERLPVPAAAVLPQSALPRRPASAGSVQHIGHGGRNPNAQTQSSLIARPVSAGTAGRGESAGEAGAIPDVPLYYEAGFEPPMPSAERHPKSLDLPPRELVVAVKAHGGSGEFPDPHSVASSPPGSPPLTPGRGGLLRRHPRPLTAAGLRSASLAAAVTIRGRPASAQLRSHRPALGRLPEAYEMAPLRSPPPGAAPAITAPPSGAARQEGDHAQLLQQRQRAKATAAQWPLNRARPSSAPPGSADTLRKLHVTATRSIDTELAAAAAAAAADPCSSDKVRAALPPALNDPFIDRRITADEDRRDRTREKVLRGKALTAAAKARRMPQPHRLGGQADGKRPVAGAAERIGKRTDARGWFAMMAATAAAADAARRVSASDPAACRNFRAAVPADSDPGAAGFERGGHRGEAPRPKSDTGRRR
eukprot:TRINITY_DN4877_c2_g1_i1.p1 TRINITY_DN4877_c2_g1~~TRINITY_DN4877_c2_g1_i1.p1  ORF type:complete len:1769 (+),score=592.89 TRINITY_DN4877_c2_g1_i1:103-5409(+)